MRPNRPLAASVLSALDVYLAFAYEKVLSGTVEVQLERLDGQWKITGMNMPQIDQIPW